eukprot:2696094-Rhodomonas_salina.1
MASQRSLFSGSNSLSALPVTLFPRPRARFQNFFIADTPARTTAHLRAVSSLNATPQALRRKPQTLKPDT